jgi:hypothetical protein
MTLPLRLLQVYVPRFLRRRGLEILFLATARAFGRETPRGDGLSFDRRLEQYARFTNDEALKPVSASERDARTDALFQSGVAMGRRLKRVFGVSTDSDAVEAMRLVYGIMGIDLRSDAPGTLTVSRCFFSGVYSPPACTVISALDDGMFAGLSGGGRLRFTGRITEGLDHCAAETVSAGGGR